MNQIRMISSSEVRRVLTFENLLPRVEESLAAFSRGPIHPSGAVQPLRSRIDVPDKNGQLLIMPGYLPKEKALATKIVSLFPENASKGLSTHSAVVVLMDASTGQILAILDGESITELRTAAASGVASKLLAPDKIHKVAVLGSGTQGASHARVHHFLFSPKEVSIWSRTKSNAQKLVDALQREKIQAVFSPTIEEATENADIINTCTLSPTPILLPKHIKKGSHINAVGAPRPDWREIDPIVMTSSVVYVDSKEAAITESGDIIQSKTEIFAEIGDVINGVKKPMQHETTIFKSLGLAILDVTSARLVYDLLDLSPPKKIDN